MKKTVKIDQGTWERLMGLRLKMERGQQRVTMDEVIKYLLDSEDKRNAFTILKEEDDE